MAGETVLSRTYDDILSTTRDTLRPLMADNITSRIPTLHFLNQRGRKEYRNGGFQIHFDVFKELGQAQGYSDLDAVQTTRATNFTRAAYLWKQQQSPITLSGRELLQNNGPEQVVDLLQARIEAGVLTLANQIGGSTSGIWSNNTESTLTSLTGLQALVSGTPTTGTVGNVARTNSFWQNQNDAVATGFNTDGLISMRTLWFACSYGSDVPDVIVFNRATMVNYLRALQATLNYNMPYTPQVASSGILDAGISTLNFFGAPVIYDDGVPANFGVFLNTKYLHFIVHQMRDFELGEFTVTKDTDAIYSHIWFMGELCASGMRYHGSLTGLPDTWA